MTFKRYQDKRKFVKTPETRKTTKITNEKIYVIQEHHATHLHWDLRLEMDGVLKSWAVPKKPPLKVGVRRLAIAVEDHLIDYGRFEGVIPKGQYGAGKVVIWDKGTYELISINENKIVFYIYGKKLNGEYCLVKTKFQGENNWLFFKTKK